MNTADLYANRKAMLEALAAGTATPEQQIAAWAHIQQLKREHAQELREAERESRDAYQEGRWNEREEAAERNAW